MKSPASVLFVCTANTCRSPMAEGMLRKLAAEAGLVDLAVASAGTRAASGSPADPRAIAAVQSLGIDLSRHTSRRFDPADLDRFDLVLAMERRHIAEINAAAAAAAGSPALLMGFAAGGAEEVPDPFDGTAHDYVLALAAIESACRGIVASLTPSGAPPPRRDGGLR